jgi:ribosomal protein L37E
MIISSTDKLTCRSCGNDWFEQRETKKLSKVDFASMPQGMVIPTFNEEGSPSRKIEYVCTKCGKVAYETVF